LTHHRDVDGLRDIAVLLVIAYHAQISFVPSGYVGVDVFFVISGFVITGLLVSQVETMNFISCPSILGGCTSRKGSASRHNGCTIGPFRLCGQSFQRVASGRGPSDVFR
jgi:hypothetical protein